MRAKSTLIRSLLLGSAVSLALPVGVAGLAGLVPGDSGLIAQAEAQTGRPQGASNAQRRAEEREQESRKQTQSAKQQQKETSEEAKGAAAKVGEEEE